MILMSAMTVILFMGGWLPPFDIFPLNIIPGVIWFTLKLFLFFFYFMGCEVLFLDIDMIN